MAYHYSRRLQLPHEEVVKKVMGNLLGQGFSMISTMDMKDKLKENEDIEFRKYLIISVCHPQISYRAISLEPNIGIVLPCNIVIQERENGMTEVSASNAMEGMDPNMLTPSLELVASELSEKLRSVVDAVLVKKPATALTRFY